MIQDGAGDSVKHVRTHHQAKLNVSRYRVEKQSFCYGSGLRTRKVLANFHQLALRKTCKAYSRTHCACQVPGTLNTVVKVDFDMSHIIDRVPVVREVQGTERVY